MIIAYYKGPIRQHTDEDTLNEGVLAQIKGWMLREEGGNVRIFRNWEEHDDHILNLEEDEE